MGKTIKKVKQKREKMEGGIENGYAPQGLHLSTDFGEGRRSRIEHAIRTNLLKDAEKARFVADL